MVRGVVINMNLGSRLLWPQATPPSTHETSLPPPHTFAITVGARTIIDEKAELSDWDACVDVLGPGPGIGSTRI